MPIDISKKLITETVVETKYENQYVVAQDSETVSNDINYEFQGDSSQEELEHEINGNDELEIDYLNYW